MSRPRGSQAVAKSRAHAPATPGPTPIAEPAWVTLAALVVVALAALALLAVAFGAHPIGDSFTESDFYDYALGGRALARGHLDFGRYGVIGPVYELVLAIPALLGIPAFAFARALSAAAAVVTLLAWFGIVRRRLGAVAGLVTVTLLAANAVWFRYGYSSTTDLVALAFLSLSLWALLAMEGRRAPWVAGAAAALATLTRYNAVALVPGAIVHFLWLARGTGATRRLALVHWLAAFGIIVLPWTALSVASGHWPGEALVGNAVFYANPTTSRNVQDLPASAPVGVREAVPPSADSPVASVAAPEGAPRTAPAPRSALVRLLANAPAHLRDDARVLLGWPVAALCALGLVALLARRRSRAWLPIGVQGAWLFVALAPVFYSDRYSLAVAPVYLSLAGAAVAAPLEWRRRGALAWVVAAALLAFPLTAALRDNVRTQRFVHGQLPLEVLDVARALRPLAHPDEGLIARKGAVAFYAGVREVAFPRFGSLAELAAHARAQHARWLYYSWYEGMLRQEFWYLLDTTAVVPGLTRVAAHLEPPAVLYRIDAGFGAPPAWSADTAALAVHVARGMVRALTDTDAFEAHMTLGRAARLAGHSTEALDEFEAAARGRPGDARPLVYAGDALLALGRLDEARDRYLRARTLNPHSLGAVQGLGWTYARAGRWPEAAAAWKPIVAAETDRATLAAMAEAFARTGDAGAATAARAALGRLASERAGAR